MEHKVICERWENGSLSNQFVINAESENWTESLEKVQTTLGQLNRTSNAYSPTEWTKYIILAPWNHKSLYKDMEEI